MNRILPIAAAVVLIILCTIVEGTWEQRWGGVAASEEVQKYAGRLDDIPMQIGDWVGKNDEVDPRQLLVAGAVGAVSRTYRHQLTGDTVSIFVVAAGRREVSTHTPDKCYQAAGYTMSQEPQPYTVVLDSAGAQKIDLLTTEFNKAEHTGTQRLRVFWAWSKDGNWLAPTGDPRLPAPWGLPRGAAWYKLYLMSQESADQGLKIDQSTCIRFAKELMPVAAKSLFPAEEAAGQQAANQTADNKPTT